MTDRPETTAPKTMFVHGVLWAQRHGGWEPATLRECGAEIERLLAMVRSLLRLIDAVPYRDGTGLRLGDAVPVIADLRAEVPANAR